MTDPYSLARAFLALPPEQRAPMPDRRRVAAPQTPRQRDQKRNEKVRERKQRLIAVLDMETDPFDNTTKAAVFPFCACLYSDQFDMITIWDENPTTFIDKVVSAIEGLDDDYTIYAHNGGKFDWQFLLHRLRGMVSFKGRGIMSARIGRCEIRDSFHIIPEKLAAYRKDAFDYTKLTKARRNTNRKEITQYLENDCRYLFEIVKSFVQKHGLKLSIGQAAMSALASAGYKVENVSEGTDAYLREYYFGGRVECIAGKGVFEGAYKLYDRNAMYPAEMAFTKHPISKSFTVRVGKPSEQTVFLDLTCDNYGALVTRTVDGETSPVNGRHRFKTTIHEYKAAIELGLIENVEIHSCVDFRTLSTFEAFVLPFYDKRQTVKERKATLKALGCEETEEWLELHKDDIFLKLLLNNAYGKFAQNPRNFKESYITTIGFRPPNLSNFADGEWLPARGEATSRMRENIATWGPAARIRNEHLGYAIWERPTDKLRFRNVATAASITGAARADLLRTIHKAVDPIYCDTDSVICRELLDSDLHGSRLGAWDLEDTFLRVIIAGKKLYGCDRGADKPDAKRFKIRSKGTSDMTWRDLETIIAADAATVVKTAKGPTLHKAGTQVYITRTIRATAKAPNTALLRAISKDKAA
jgi:DNA polymerase elongation subunit (family B)